MSFDDLGLEETSSPTVPSEIRLRGRPKGRLNTPTADDLQRQDLHLGMKEVHYVASGVSITWLSKIFRMNSERVKAALVDCPVLKTGQNGGSIYDVKMAAAYLVDPITDVGKYLLTIDPKLLPQRLQEGYWNARIKEMKARTMAGELWPTVKVQEVLGETFQMIKSTVQLWADTVEEEIGEMTPEQRDYMITLSDNLLDQIYKSLVEKASNQSTESWVAELDAD